MIGVVLQEMVASGVHAAVTGYGDSRAVDVSRIRAVDKPGQVHNYSCGRRGVCCILLHGDAAYDTILIESSNCLDGAAGRLRRCRVLLVVAVRPGPTAWAITSVPELGVVYTCATILARAAATAICQTGPNLTEI